MKVKELVLCAFLSSILIISKEILSFLPNIELVTCLLMVYTSVLSVKRSIFIALLFSLIQTLLYGMGTWTPMYFIVWPGLCFIFNAIKPLLERKLDYCAFFAAIFGFCFGTLFALPYLFIGGVKGFIAYVFNGLVFDCVHCFSNYCLVLLTYEPIKKTLQKLIVRF